MTAVVNRAVRPGEVPAPRTDALAFHQGLDGYEPTPVHELPDVARALGVAAVLVKDESNRLGLPAFKILGASWAVELGLRDRPGTRTLIAASAGNHGRAVARVAAMRGLACRIFLPSRSLPARREAIAAEGARVKIVDGPYEEVVAAAASAAAGPDTLLVADVGASGPAEWVVDGYATLFEEATRQAEYDLLLVPVGVGSLAAAAARHAALDGRKLVGVEPATAACLTVSLEGGRPTAVPTPGTVMAGLDCAEVSLAAWPSLRDGVHGTITVDDAQAVAAMRELSGLGIGECGAATLAALRRLMTDPACESLKDFVGAGPTTRVLLIATEGRTGG